MKLLTSLRTTSALWAAPFAIGLTLFYYAVAREAPLDDYYKWAPSVVADALAPVYAFAYAIASALAAWESSRLKKAGIWSLAPARSRYRVALNILGPVLTLSWLMLVLPTVLGLVDEGVLPDLRSLRPFFLGLLLCLAHAVIGFAVGLYVPHLIAAPLLAVTVWGSVSFSVTSSSFWYRHVSGQFFEPLMFGEVAPVRTLVPHALFTGSLAVAAMLLWTPMRSIGLRVLLAVAVAAAGTATARNIVNGWGPTEPVVGGAAPMRCSGAAPAVCMPTVNAAHLQTVRRDVESVLKDLRATGVPLSPDTITDTLGDGRTPRRSTPREWRVNFTRGLEDGNVRYRLVNAAMSFPCSMPDPTKRREVLWWAATVTGEEKAYRKQWRASREEFDNESSNTDRVRAEVKRVRSLPPREQADWAARARATACGRTP
ncbi:MULTISPECIES: hypothetical protein [unclassified Streptomyces]|uniref:DUF7224 domain-containing protein n=1 Tax=unclassified Streptomyces TaxID=2593676 RepID=UPI00336A0E66